MADHSAPYVHRTVPNGSAELVCTIGAPLRVRGPQTGPVEQLDEPGSVVVGVRLRPTAAQSVLGVPPTALLDLEVDLSAVLGSSTTGLEDALAMAASPQTAAALVEQEVTRRLADAPDLDPIATEATRRLGLGQTSGIAQLAHELCVSPRQLRRRVEMASGLGPKLLQRIMRFQQFLAMASGVDRSSTELARLAAEAGYADQSHLGRDAMRFEGRTPAAVLRLAESRCRCAHDHSASYAPLTART